MSRPLRTLLVVDDDRLFCDAVAEHFGSEQLKVVVAHGCADALRCAASRRIDAVLLDQKLPDGPGHAICAEILARHEDAKILFITAFPSYENAVEAIHAGAFDYLSKPVDLAELELILNRVWKTCDLERVAALHDYSAGVERAGLKVVGLDQGLAALGPLLAAAIRSEAPVLLTGETGTGKNVLARHIHAAGRRPQAPFIVVNCAALPESLIEAELFGFERGAFTGAQTGRKGILEMAEGGTLVLDEIGEMAPHLQAKLLGVLDTSEYRRLGSEVVRRARVRVIASTCIDLESAVSQRRFRSDLLYRLGVIRLHLPALRHRPGDRPGLVERLLQDLAPARRVSVSPAELERLAGYPWPGNVRELRNVLERALLTSEGVDLRPALLLGTPPTESPDLPPLLPEGLGPPVPTLAEVERRHLLAVLRGCGENRTRAARLLGISLSTLKRKLALIGDP